MTELRVHENRTRGVSITDGDVSNNVRMNIAGVSARVGKNGIYGFSSMADTTMEAGKAVLKAATDNAVFMDKHVNKERILPSTIPTGKEELRHQVVDTEQKNIVEFAKELDAYMAKKCPELKSHSVTIREQSREKILYTSDGYDAHTAIPRSSIYVNMTALTPDGKPVELFDSQSLLANYIDMFKDPKDFYKLIDDTYTAIMRKREGVYAEAGLKTVILGGEMAGMLAHEAVGHTVEADLVRGGSVAGPMLNKQVASPLISLTDFAYEAFGKPVPLPVYVDEEGTKCTDCEIIKDGILVGYMNSRETATLYGQKPCGNARAFQFSDEPLIRMRNTLIHPGKDKLEDMIASIDDGYYLVQSGNGQADYTGEFIFGVNEGYEIKKGKITRPILDTTVSGVAFEMLKTVDMVSDNITWSPSGTCGKKQPMPVSDGGPEIRCKITIGGR
ncbi:MAG: TldD/PmbA family protein [Lachnospiraceae bacterium]|nr:TldD/PmbA family protein [Lachnospiraceae bacterium]